MSAASTWFRMHIFLNKKMRTWQQTMRPKTELCNMWWLHCILLVSVSCVDFDHWTEPGVLKVALHCEAHCSDQISREARKKKDFSFWSDRLRAVRRRLFFFLFNNVSLIRKLNSWHNKRKVTCGCVLIERLTAGRTDNNSSSEQRAQSRLRYSLEPWQHVTTIILKYSRDSAGLWSLCCVYTHWSSIARFLWGCRHVGTHH